MNGNSHFKRVALVVNALSGNELKAGKSDSGRVFQVLVDPALGACDPGSATLVRDCPDRDAFNKALLGVLEGWSAGDQLLLYFSGHGEERKGLYHLRFGADKKSHFPFKNILTELVSAGVSRAILVLDSCQSGAALRKGEKSALQPPVISPDEIPKGLAIITSSRASENSHEKGDQTQSVFTGLFCDAITSGLSGSPTPDGKVSISDLVGWVNKTLQSDPNLAGFSQTAMYGIDGAEHPVWIALNKSGRTSSPDVDGPLKLEADHGSDKPNDFDKWLTPVSAFSSEIVKSFREKLRPDVRDSMLPDSLDERSFLTRANLFSRGRLYATGVLLFSEQPERLIPGAYVQCFEFAGVHRSAPQDQKEIYGPLMRQLEGAMTFIESRIEKVEITEQGALAARFEFQYPMACLRELLANALCHRDYLDGARHTHVRVFQDRIELVSPGLWGSKMIPESEEMDIAELESESATRNERLATALRRIRLVETGGSGIPSALSDCKERGAKSPTALSRDGTVKVTIYPRTNWSKTNFGRRGTQESPGQKRFRVAFSFAGEKRDFVAAVAALLAQRLGESAVLYDKFHEAEFARSDLGFYLPELYHKQTDLVVVVVCPDYDQKKWTGLEWNAIRNLLKNRRVEEVLLARFDHAKVDGLFENAGFIELDDRTPEQATALILERLALNEGKRKDFYTSDTNATERSTRRAIPNNLPRLRAFFGREQELARIAEALGPHARGWGALIDGPGGIGKTSLAIRAAELVPDGRFRRIIFVSSKERELTADGQRALGNFVLPSYLEMLDAIARELDQPNLAKSPENERPQLVLRALRDAEVLLVLDNLETLSGPDRDQLFAFLNRLPRGSGAIVTSRRRTDVGAISVRLDRLDWGAANALLAELGRDFPQFSQATDAERRALYEETGGNPLLIRWVVGQLGRGHCRTVASALDLLRSAPVGNSPLEFILGDLLDTFTENEVMVLAALSHFTAPIEVKFIAELGGVSEVAANTALGDLASRALVLTDAEEHRFVLVPLVADFLRRKRPEAVRETGNRLEQRAYALIEKNGSQKHNGFPVLDAAWPSIAPALPLFLVGSNRRLQTICDALGQFLNFTGRWDEWLLLSQRAETKAAAESDHDKAGWRAYDAGMVHSLREQADEVLACAVRATAHWKSAEASPRELALAVQMRGIGYQLKADYSAAIAAYRESLDLQRNSLLQNVDLANALNHIADAERLSGDLRAAERDYRNALGAAREGGDAEASVISMGNLAALALNGGNGLAAEALAREGLLLSEKLGHLELIARLCRVLAESLLRLQKPGEGLPYARRAVDIYTRLASPNLDAARETMLKCES